MVFRKPNAASASVGEGAELWADAIREFRTTRADLKQAGSWDQVSHYYCLRWGIDPAGANVEGNKRDRVLGDYMDRHDIETNMDEEYHLVCQADTPRRDPQVPNPMSEAAAPEAPRGPPPPVPVSSQHNSASYAIPPSPNMSEMSSWSSTRLSSPSVAPSVAGEKDVNGLPCYPEGIYTLEAWGNTLIEFGKLKGRGWSYHQLSQDGLLQGFRGLPQVADGPCSVVPGTMPRSGTLLCANVPPQHAAGKSLPYPRDHLSPQLCLFGKQPVKAGSHDSRPRARLPEAEDQHSNEILVLSISFFFLF